MEVRNIDVTRKGLKQMMNVIKSKKKILFFTFLSMVLLFGCNNGKEQSVADKLYKDLDAKETYEKAVEYSNENLTYMKCKVISKGGENERVKIYELFNEGGKYNQITYSISYVYGPFGEKKINKEWNFAEKLILKDGKGSYLSSWNGVFEERVRETNDKSFYKEIQVPFFQTISQNLVNIHDISKEEDGDHILIKIKYETNNKDIDEEYCILEIVIDSNGLIIEERTEHFTDSTVEKKFKFSTTARFGDFNKKTTFDYEEERQKLKDLEGKDIEVIKDMFE